MGGGRGEPGEGGGLDYHYCARLPRLGLNIFYAFFIDGYN